jgi:hypothetical protein
VTAVPETTRSGAANDIEAVLLELRLTLGVAVGYMPPYRQLASPATLEVVARLFTLSTIQAVVFAKMAGVLMRARDGITAHGALMDVDGCGGLSAASLSRCRPLRMLVLGEPGVGKSQSIHALLWWAFQAKTGHMVALGSYTWKACQSISTETHSALTTSTFFGIGRSQTALSAGALKTLQDRIRPLALYIDDEISFTPQNHFGLMASRAGKACQGLGRTPADEEPEAFGDLNVVLFGDLFQHKPPGGVPLFGGAAIPPVLCPEASDEEKAKTAANAAGRRAFLEFEDVFIISEQQRIDRSTADGEKLYKISRLFMGRDVTREAMEAACDELNAKAVTAQKLLELEGTPRCVALRHKVRRPINTALLLHHAVKLGVRPMRWEPATTMSTEIHDRVVPVVDAGLSALVYRMPAKDTEFVDSYQYFFPGILYTLHKGSKGDSFPSLGLLNNNSAVGVDIELDAREPADTGEGMYRKLHFPPVGIVVRPEMPSGRSFGNVCGGGVPEGCIVLKPRAVSFTVKLPEPFVLPGPSKTQVQKGHRIKCERTGFLLGGGYCVTDFYVQGLTFQEFQAWLAHLNFPPDGRMFLSSVFVVLSRFRSWKDVHLLVPLWPRGDKEKRKFFIDKMFALATMRNEHGQDLVQDMKRLTKLAEETRIREAALFAKF